MDYKIVEEHCELCLYEYRDNVLEPMAQEKGWRENNGKGAIKKEFSEEWGRLYQGAEVPKTVVARLGQDYEFIYLCADHLIAIAEKIKGRNK